tara:strand:- start:198 stop:761 length:564 start_codon:yes stop_codon:yes gene_type:complete
MGSALSQAPNLAKALPLIAGGITGASTMKPEDIQTILSTLSGGNPTISNLKNKLEGVDAEVEEGEVVDESEIEEIKEKLKEIDKQRVRDRKESGDYEIDPDKEEFGEQEQLDLQKRLIDIIGLAETLDVRDEISMDREYMDEIDPGRFSKRDLYNNEPNEKRLKQANPEKKKKGGMIDKSISYPPRN